MKKQDNPFATIVDGILSGVSNETREEYGKEIEVLKGIKDAEDYSMYIAYPLSNVLEESIRAKYPNIQRDGIHRIEFLYKNYHFVESHLESFIIKKEGRACSADKSRYIIRAYEKYYADGTPLKLPYSEEDEKNKCYWKPHFWDDKTWLELLESLVDIYYGSPLRYLQFMKTNVVQKEIDDEEKNIT